MKFLLLAALALASASLAQTPEPYPARPAPLPGRGLAQHDFLYSGEWDTRKDVCTMFLVRGGHVVWTYQIPRKDETNGQESEYSDMHRLSNGDIVFAYKTGWRKITAEGKVLFDYKCPQIGQTADGKPFHAKPDGPLADRVAAVSTAAKMVGKMLTIKFQELSDTGVPRFPVAKGFVH
jgi:hypothetical protein